MSGFENQMTRLIKKIYRYPSHHQYDLQGKWAVALQNILMEMLRIKQRENWKDNG